MGTKKPSGQKDSSAKRKMSSAKDKPAGLGKAKTKGKRTLDNGSAR
jgi:hypothetical protein